MAQRAAKRLWEVALGPVGQALSMAGSRVFSQVRVSDLRIPSPPSIPCRLGWNARSLDFNCLPDNGNRAIPMLGVPPEGVVLLRTGASVRFGDAFVTVFRDDASAEAFVDYFTAPTPVLLLPAGFVPPPGAPAAAVPPYG